MSSGPQFAEFPKGLLLTIRLISLTFSQNQAKFVPYIEAKINNNSWITSKNIENSSKIHWSLNHTFEIPEISPLSFRIYSKSGFFKENNFGSTVIKEEVFNSKKGIRITEIFNNEMTKITLIWSFIIEEDRKFECEDYLKLINEVEVEREEIRFHKNNIKNKLQKFKEKSKTCKEQLRKIMQSMEPILEVYQDKEKMLNDRALIIAERKRVDKQASEMLYLKVRIQKEYERLAHNGPKPEFNRPLKTL